MLKLNYELAKKIQQIVNANPKADEDFVVDKIVTLNTLRMKKQSVKIGVKQYFKSKIAKVEIDKRQSPTPTTIEIDKPKKKVKKSQLQFQFQDNPLYKFESLGGVEQAVSQIKNTIFMPIQRAQHLSKLGTSKYKGFLLTGPVGCGKTLLGNCILSYMKNAYNFNTYSVYAGNLVSADAQQNIKKLFQIAKQNQPSAVFIDQIDIMCSKQTSKRPQGSPMSCLVNEIDKLKQCNVYLIGTSSCPQKLDVGLKKVNRLDKMISISATSDQARKQILTKLLANTHNNISELQISEIAAATSGFMAADLVMLIKEAGLHALQQNQIDPTLSAQLLMTSLKFVQPILKKEGFTDIPTTTLDDVGGLKHLKQQLERQIIIPMRQQKRFRQLNFDIQSGGVLLYGPPGCGKTMLAKAIANAVRANFIIVKGPQLLNKYVGESEQAVREVFGRAQRASPCVIFFDEFDALAPKRSDQGNQVTERVVNTLLTALDGVQERKMVFVIAATNRKDMIDQATLRAGRIQKHLYVPEPTESQRIQILKAITKHMKINKSIQFNQIAKKTKGFSGADLKFLVKEATVTAVMKNSSEVDQEDLKKALDELLQAKKANKLQQKVHQIELKDDEQNQHFAYHFESQKNKVEVQMQKQKKYNNGKDIISQFMDFLNYKINRK